MLFLDLRAHIFCHHECEIAADLGYFNGFTPWELRPMLKRLSMHNFAGSRAFNSQLVLHFLIKLSHQLVQMSNKAGSCCFGWHPLQVRKLTSKFFVAYLFKT